MIKLEEREHGVVVSVRAQPRARKEGLQGEHNGMLKIGVTAPPEGGRANQALIAVLAELFHLRKNQIELLTGATSREKSFLLRGTTRSQIEPILAQLFS